MELGRYLPSVPSKVREFLDRATNMVMNYSETEMKLIEATNDQAWGPSGTLLQELSQLSYSPEQYNELISLLWKRCLGQHPRNWRRIYKSLLVLTYLCKNGSEKVVRSTREHLYDLRNLENFVYHDERHKDQGINIRIKVKELTELIQDPSRISDERKRARASRDKYIGLGRESSSYELQKPSPVREQPWFDPPKQAMPAEPAPIIDLLGDEEEFGEFQEAPSVNRGSDNLLDIFSEPTANDWFAAQYRK